MPSSSVSKSHKSSEFNFKRFYDADQPSSSSSTNAFNQTRKTYTNFTNGRKLNGGGRDDDDIQLVSISQKTNSVTRPFSRDMPSLIPISKTFQSSIMTNGYSRESSIKPIASQQPTRGRRSVLDFLGKNRVSPMRLFQFKKNTENPLFRHLGKHQESQSQ